MSPELTAAIAVIITAILLLVGSKVISLIDQFIDKLGVDKTNARYSLLEKLIESLVVKFQQEYVDSTGMFKSAKVVDQIKKDFPELVKSLKFTDAQLEVVVKRMYEFLRNANLGGRFIIYEQSKPHTHDIPSTPVERPILSSAKTS